MPIPRIVSDSPDTTCSAPSTTVNHPCTSATAAPVSTAMSRASHGFPNSSAAMKPLTAPMAIIPSTPRFRMPAFSETISPNAAR